MQDEAEVGRQGGGGLTRRGFVRVAATGTLGAGAFGTASLVTGIRRAQLYDASATIDLTPPPPERKRANNSCHRLWLDTKRCTVACCEKLSGWFLCR